MYDDNAHVDNEVLQGTLNVIGRLSMTSEKRLEAELQMHAYRMRTGTYSDTQLQYAVGRVSPGKQPEIVEDTEQQLEPARYSESDSRPVTPRMVKPPPSLRRTMSGIYMTERANAVARDDPAIEKMRQIYVRRTPKGKGKELHTKTQGEMATSSEKKKESKTRRRRLVSYTSEDNDDDDDPSATAGATTGGGIYTQSQSDYGHDSQGDYYGHDSQGQYGQDSQGQYGQDSQGQYGHHLGYGHYAHEPKFQFQPLPANSSYDSVSSSHARDSSPYSDSGFQSTQQPFTPRGIQRGMNDLATSLFGYSEYSEYKNPLKEKVSNGPADELCGDPFDPIGSIGVKWTPLGPSGVEWTPRGLFNFEGKGGSEFKETRPPFDHKVCLFSPQAYNLGKNKGAAPYKSLFHSATTFETRVRGRGEISSWSICRFLSTIG
ncbi:hypothetical protein Taro_032438 [Colocasia esculenta]|uniref:Uncharacterized protein n=1 Tax=Colocasia esculenta TaxID=4460 RepID=A0A843VRC6_COLES|nr:hypothetical protein [Colocasia esculenta]